MTRNPQREILAYLLAGGIIRRQNPIKDLMTRNELYKEFGRMNCKERLEDYFGIDL